MKKYSKLLLAAEIFIIILALVTLLGTLIIASYCLLSNLFYICLILLSAIIFTSSILFALRLEQLTGFYVCKKCQHKHTSTYWEVFWAPHMGFTRYLKCPNCNNRSWHKKSLE